MVQEVPQLLFSNLVVSYVVRLPLSYSTVRCLYYIQYAILYVVGTIYDTVSYIVGTLLCVRYCTIVSISTVSVVYCIRVSSCMYMLYMLRSQTNLFTVSYICMSVCYITPSSSVGTTERHDQQYIIYMHVDHYPLFCSM